MSPYFRSGDPRARARTRWSSPLRPHPRGRLEDGSYQRAPDETLKLIHQDIGYIKGSTTKPGVVQFLGVQYALLADPFSPPELKTYDKNSVTKATKLGPVPLSEYNGNKLGPKAIIQNTLDVHTSDHISSETECLHLNITVPLANDLKYLPDDRSLPVFVFIHGGDSITSSANCPQYDLANLVNLGTKHGKPFIGVGINYRLGTTGFTFSEEMRDAGYKPNNSLRDQRTAMLWIKRYITGFGGDAVNVTLAGESAGAASVSYHMQSKEPLFQRALLISGSDLATHPLTQQDANALYEVAISRSSLAKEMPARKIQKLDTVSTLPKTPVIDPGLPLAANTFKDIQLGFELPAFRWCEGVMLGDCQSCAQIYSLQFARRKRDIGNAFRQSINRTLQPKDAKKLLLAYDLGSHSDDESALDQILSFFADIMLFAPTIYYASAFASTNIQTYVYRFNELSSWDRFSREHGTHAQETTFLLQNFSEHLEEPQRQLAQHFAGDVICFVHGDAPWQRQQHGGEGMARVYGPEGKVEDARDVPERVGRRSVIFELAESVQGGMDKLKSAADAFLLAA